MIKQSIPAWLAGSVLALAAACSNAQVLKERITWNWSSGIQGKQMLALYDAGSTFQSFRTWQFGSAWRLVGTAGNYLDEWLLIADPILRTTGGDTFAPASLNAYWDQGNDGAMVQILFNQTSPTSMQGRALVVNVRDKLATPFGRQVLKREIWTHTSSNNTAVYATSATQEASAHDPTQRLPLIAEPATGCLIGIASWSLM